MKNLKLNALNKKQLNKREMNTILGGGTCGCGCAYADNGGSSTNDNGSANAAGGLVSPGGGSPRGPEVIVKAPR